MIFDYYKKFLVSVYDALYSAFYVQKQLCFLMNILYVYILLFIFVFKRYVLYVCVCAVYAYMQYNYTQLEYLKYI